ncbi:MAG TPA: hypothetical protein VJ912_00300 [Candidatus Nanoarchaeia archaeon]|nr:hypothetical protein [Candidatus Nanoarchaeia archaeon]
MSEHHDVGNPKEDMKLYANMHEIAYEGKIRGKEINEYGLNDLKELKSDLLHFSERHPEYRRGDEEITNTFDKALSNLEKVLKDKTE